MHTSVTSLVPILLPDFRTGVKLVQSIVRKMGKAKRDVTERWRTMSLKLDSKRIQIIGGLVGSQPLKDASRCD